MAERLFDHLTVDNDEAKLDGSIIKNLDNNEEFSQIKEDLNNVVYKAGTGQVTEQNTTFFELSDNVFNYKTAISGKRLTSDGGLMDASAYVTSDYIDVSNIDYITGYRHNGHTLSTPTLEYAMYDPDFSVISGRSGKSGSVDVRGVAYIRFDGTNSIKNQYMIVDSSKTVTSYIPYETTFKYASDNVIHLTPADDIIQSLIDNAGSTFVFDNGNYDIIAIYESKYGSDYFTNYAGYNTNNVADRGLPVLRGTKIKCSQGAVFTCNYAGSNESVRNNFSAFALESAVEINELRLTASGIRNCIHDDFDNFYAGTTPTIIKNCILEHDRMVIAGGLAQHDIVIIENCIFNDTFVNHVSDFYYHNNSNSDAQSLMIVKDCYLNKGIGIKYYGSSTKMTDVIITNNSMANAIDFGANSGATVENMQIKEWNNVLRT